MISPSVRGDAGRVGELLRQTPGRLALLWLPPEEARRRCRDRWGSLGRPWLGGQVVGPSCSKAQERIFNSIPRQLLCPGLSWARGSAGSGQLPGGSAPLQCPVLPSCRPQSSAWISSRSCCPTSRLCPLNVDRVPPHPSPLSDSAPLNLNPDVFLASLLSGFSPGLGNLVFGHSGQGFPDLHAD